IKRQIRVELAHGMTQRRSECLRALPRMRTNDKRSEEGRRRDSEQRDIESAVIGLLIEWPLHQGVGDNAHDCSPRLRLRRIENANPASNRTFIAPIFSR